MPAYCREEGMKAFHECKQIVNNQINMEDLVFLNQTVIINKNEILFHNMKHKMIPISW